MALKQFLLAVTISALVGAAFAACPNACSGHGACGNHDKCACYSNWAGSDCSSKACPHAHGAECSGRGVCDSGAGECACPEGYSGEACQRTLCPNDCSGNGNCDTSSGLCHCFGGYSGNDCSSRMCAKGDDPLTHEVENQGAGTIMQQAEVQEVTFAAGSGVGGEATLTYTDLYGQDWTTRPFAVGGENHFVLEYALGTGFNNAKSDLVLSYGGVAQFIDLTALSGLTAAKIREKLLAISTIYVPGAGTRANKGREVYVTERPDPTSIKLNGIIEHSARKIFDIYITPDPVTGHDENGGLLEFKSFFGAGSTTEDTTLVAADLGYTAITSGGDHSTDIQNALESLPNQVIPSVTVSKALATSANTAVLGTYGNAYHQTYRITFSASANSGDQHLLACDASPCDHDGCANRKAGVADVKYIHYSDATNAWKKINFQGAGTFTMTVHSTDDNGETAAAGDFSAGMGYLKWNTGNGVETADFALIGNAAAVQTALRTISGWEAVTVATSDTDFTAPHAFTVTFPAGYDDGGQIPVTGAYASSVYTRGGTKAASATVSVVDQRFSNSLWMGEISGWHKFTAASNVFTGANSKPKAESGDVFEFSTVQYGFENTGATSALSITNKCVASASNAAIPCIATVTSADNAKDGKVYGRIDYTADRPTQTSQQTEDYFAVGASIEVMTTTWADGALGTDVTTSTNKHRKFKVLSHVTNGHGKMFAKLDGSPETDSSTDYTLRVTSNNGTTTALKSVNVVASVNEVQNIRVLSGANIFAPVLAQGFRLYINKGKPNEEFTEVVTHGSTNAQIAEAINSFSALSGPVKVTNTFHGFNTGADASKKTMVITFDAIDGDVPLLHAESVGNPTAGALSTSTITHGSSISGGAGARFEHMEAGGTINITSQETVTFTVPSGGTSNAVAFSYDGIMQSANAVALSGAINDGGTLDDALATITDDNGVKVVGAASEVVATHASDTITVTLKKGLSGSKLEMHAVTGGVHTSTTKTVNRNNNGKTFRIKRVGHEKVALANNVISATKLTISREDYNFRVGDEVAITGCTATNAAEAPCSKVTPCYRKITAEATAAAGTTIMTIPSVTATDVSDCVATLIRDTLILDSIPDAMNGAVDITYTAPSGSCSVSEVTKGSSESATCSNRGSCDGGSGLCVCHEGYSGEACETQTVLV